MKDREEYIEILKYEWCLIFTEAWDNFANRIREEHSADEQDLIDEILEEVVYEQPWYR